MKRDQPAWILCRGLHQFPIPDDATLRRWAERSRVRPDDYLFNPRLDTCVQARELPALEIFFKGNIFVRFAMAAMHSI